LVLLVLALPLLMAGECEAPLVKDSSFDLWCGDMLCAWELDEGTIAKAPTWNEHDHGVALLGSSARISQLLPYGSADVSCIHFDLLADVGADASVTLELDFDDDGTVDATQALTTGAWTPVEYRWVTPTYFQSVRLSIRKSGAGRAVLARIQASKAADCPGAPPVGALARPPGATCESAEQCSAAAGACRARPLDSELIPDPSAPRSVCATCAADTDCAPSMLCGLAWSPAFTEPYPACVAPAARALGERCLQAAECTTGVCCQGVCSTCCAGDRACAAGQACAARPRDATGSPLRAAFQCGPGQATGAALAPCLGDADCASGHCAAGTILSVCAADGRTCALPTDCPFPDQNPCIALGVAGGRCD